MASFVTACDSQSVNHLKARLNSIYRIIDTHRWIIEAYLSDFFVKDHWSNVPESWQQYLSHLDFSHLSFLLTGKPWCQPTAQCGVSPLSLQALRVCCQHLALRRQCVDLDNSQVRDGIRHSLMVCSQSDPQMVACREADCYTEEDPDSDNVETDSASTGISKGADLKNGQLMEMEHIFRKHVKPKKQHEIRQLGKVIHLVSELSGYHHVVDVGAGLGHLSRLLTFAHGLKVTTVEASDGHAPKASEFDRELEKDIQKKLKRHEAKNQQNAESSVSLGELPDHVVCMVRPDITTEEFLRLVLKRDSSGERLLDSANSGTDQASGSTTPAAVWQTAEFEDSRSSNLQGTSMFEELQESKARIKENQESTTRIKKNKKSNHCCFCKNGNNHVCGMNRKIGDNTGLQDGPASCGTRNSDCTDARSLPATGCLLNSDINRTGSGDSGVAAGYIRKEEHCHCQSFNTQMHDGSQPAVESKDFSSIMLEKELCSKSKQENQSYENTRCQNSNAMLDKELCSKSKQEDQSHQNGFLPAVNCTPTSWAGLEDDKNVGDTHSTDDEKEDNSQGGENGAGLLLAGLHACGDLTATLLRVYAKCPAVGALVSVGCCYMKLSHYYKESVADLSETGYPMSKFVRCLPAHRLTYESREMACHFSDAYAQRLQASPPHLKIHAYRAAVQYIVMKVKPDFVTGTTRLVVKRGAEIPFTQYSQKCLQRLGIDQSLVPDDVMSTAEEMAERWRQVVAFYTLRLSLAPLLETAVLLDRMLYLYEQGFSSALVPVFDSALSPRNFALLSCKS